LGFPISRFEGTIARVDVEVFEAEAKAEAEEAP